MMTYRKKHVQHRSNPAQRRALAAGLAYLEKDLLVARRHLDWLSVATLAAPMT